MSHNSFKVLKEKRSASAISYESAEKPLHVQSSSPSIAIARCSPKYPNLDIDLLEIREDSHRGRGMFAKKRLEPGSIFIQMQPHLAMLDKRHLPLLCSHCMLDNKQTQPTLRRCSACKAIFYCSQVRKFATRRLLINDSCQACQKADWQPDRHKMECVKLQEWYKMCKAAGRPLSEHIPETPVRALGRLIMLKEHMDDNARSLKAAYSIQS